MNLRIFDDHEELMHATARTIVQRVQEGARTIALSGGSTPKPLYEMLGRAPLRMTLADYPITWVVVDERYVPLHDPQSNAGMMEETLFAEGLAPTHRFLRFRTELNDPEATATAFCQDFAAAGITKLDVVLLGIGDDGHTASIFPESPLLDFDPRTAAAVFVPKMHMYRVTLTMSAIRAAALRLVLVTGASKRPILEAVRSGDATYPIARATQGVDTWWLVDRASAPAE